MSELLDPDLLQFIDSIEGQTFESIVWRVTWASRDPIAGNAGGGRWSPQDSFEVLYTSLEADGALAEIYYHLSRAPVFSSSQTKLHRLEVSLRNVLLLGDDELVRLGIEDPYAPRLESKRSQEIGEAAYLMGFEGIVVPSARWACKNLVLFTDRIKLIENIELIESKDVNWPAWKEKSS